MEEGVKGVPPGPSVGNDQGKVASVGKARRASSRHRERSPTVGKRRSEPKAQQISNFHFLEIKVIRIQRKNNKSAPQGRK